MKVTKQTQSYQPLTITLETKEDFDAMVRVLVAANNHTAHAYTAQAARDLIKMLHAARRED